MKYKSLTELKDIARDKMLGNYGTAIGAFLFMRIILYFAMIIFGQISNNMIINMAIIFVIALFEGIFVYGELSIYLKLSVGMDIKVSDVCSAFSVSTNKAVLSRLFLLLLSYGWVIIGAAVELMCNTYIAGLPVVKYILTIGILCGFIAQMLSYSQVLFLLHDFGDLTVVQAFSRSRHMMNGKKMSLLKIYLSFIPIYIAGILSMCIGIFFIHPYFKMTLTEFYLDRVRTDGAGQAE